jgi:hypothetical protein
MHEADQFAMDERQAIRLHAREGTLGQGDIAL